MQATARGTRAFLAHEILQMHELGVLQDREPFELLGGELVLKVPQGPRHGNTASRLTARLLRAYDGRAVRVDMPMMASETDMPEPDLGVFLANEDEYWDRHPRGDESILIVEVAKTSLARDHGKAAIYARSGVGVFWLLDLDNELLEVHTEPRPDGTYGVVQLLKRDEAVKLPDVDVTWQVSDLLPPAAQKPASGSAKSRSKTRRRR